MISPGRIPVSPAIAGFVAVVASLAPVHGAPVPHADRPDRLVETRDGFSVEYSPGQEPWVDMAFEQMKAAAGDSGGAPPIARRPGPAAPGSAQFLLENRGPILAAVSRQIGLDRPTGLQARTFDTFLGYYQIAAEMRYAAVQQLPLRLPARHIAIWQRDELVARMKAGGAIEGMTYDPVTDSGNFSFRFDLTNAVLGDRFNELQAEIEAQRLKHSFNQDAGTLSAGVTLGKAPGKSVARATMPSGPASNLDAILSQLTIPIIYVGPRDAAPREEAFAHVSKYLAIAREALAQQAAEYRDPAMVGLILHETAEIGLVGDIIASRDRRWLCDGTANYAAWRVARDLLGLEFAQQVYDLDAKLAEHAMHQPKIDLARWSAAENEDEGDAALNRAHYTFATRAMFLLAERHGENALAQLWSDVARSPKKKVTARTFAEAYRKRFKGDLGKLVREAERNTIPAPAEPSPSTP